MYAHKLSSLLALLKIGSCQLIAYLYIVFLYIILMYFSRRTSKYLLWRNDFLKSYSTSKLFFCYLIMKKLKH